MVRKVDIESHCMSYFVDGKTSKEFDWLTEIPELAGWPKPKIFNINNFMGK